ncbi:histidine kinase [Actinomadura sp. NPDC000600]|uniref:sensor histidine kinase n=1 Tax=Actinomadura sp. NPDC000600 TaxID=3154262 RepID=UPI003396E43F
MRKPLPASRFRWSGRWLTTAAVAAAVAVAAGTAAGFWLDALNGDGRRPEPLAWSAWGSTVPGLALALAGAILATRLPRHVMTWLLVGGGVLACGNGVAAAYASFSLLEHGGALPLTSLAAYIGGRTGPSLNLIPPLFLLFFPDGRLPSPRWRWPVGISLACTGLALLFGLTAPWRVFVSAEGESPDGPSMAGLALDPTTPPLPDAAWRTLLGLILPLIAVSLFVPVAAFVRRFFGADPERRAQLRWMLLAALLNLALMAVPLLAPGNWVNDAAFAAGLVALAAAVLIAVSRYRLYEVDLLLGRTLLYGGLAAAVVAIDMAVFLSVGTLLDEPLAAITGAGVVAVLYAPLRARLQRSVARLVTGRGDPYDVVSALARRLEDSSGSGELLVEVAQAVGAAFRSPYVRVEMNRTDGHTVVAEHGTASAGAVVLPVAYRGVPIGRLTLVPQTGTRLSDADQRLLADVVRQAAAAVRATALTEELQRSREHLVTSVAEERRRLRRDMHDGLGPALAAAALKIEAARNLAARDPAAADRTLADVRRDLSAVLADVRRLVHDLRPPALDQFGLVGAVQRQISRFDGAGLAITLDLGAPGAAAGSGEALADLPAAVEVAGYRIVCEALANVTRHAAASRCTVRLAAPADALEIEITDNGRGMAPDAVVGVGLLGMRERAEELGGQCTVTSLPCGGTRVHAVIPYRASARRHDHEKRDAGIESLPAADLGGA